MEIPSQTGFHYCQRRRSFIWRHNGIRGSFTRI